MRIPEQFAGQQVGESGYRVLGLDLDGVCADYVQGLRLFMAENGWPDALDYPAPDDYNLVKATGWPFRTIEEYFEVQRAAVQAHLYRDLPVMPLAAQVLQELSEHHVHIRIVTHRLFLTGLHEVIVADTAAWLERHGFPYMSLCFTGLKDSIEANYYVEDAPAAAHYSDKIGQRYVIFDHLYNRDVTGLRLYRWEGALPFLLDQFEQPAARRRASLRG